MTRKTEILNISALVNRLDSRHLTFGAAAGSLWWTRTPETSEMILCDGGGDTQRMILVLFFLPSLIQFRGDVILTIRSSCFPGCFCWVFWPGGRGRCSSDTSMFSVHTPSIVLKPDLNKMSKLCHSGNKAPNWKTDYVRKKENPVSLLDDVTVSWSQKMSVKDSWKLLFWKLVIFLAQFSSGKTRMIIQKDNQSCFKMNVLETVYFHVILWRSPNWDIHGILLFLSLEFRYSLLLAGWLFEEDGCKDRFLGTTSVRIQYTVYDSV